MYVNPKLIYNFSMFWVNHMELLSCRSKIAGHRQSHLIQSQNNYSRTLSIKQGCPEQTGTSYHLWLMPVLTASLHYLKYKAPPPTPSPSVIRLRYKEDSKRGALLLFFVHQPLSAPGICSLAPWKKKWVFIPCQPFADIYSPSQFQTAKWIFQKNHSWSVRVQVTILK